MVQKKKKWTVIDTVIVVVLAAAAAGGFKMFGGKVSGGEKTAITARILIPNQDPQLGAAIEAGKGQNVTLSLTEKDSGILKDVEVRDAELMVFNATDGVYSIQRAEINKDIIATVEIEVTEDDYAFTAGSTPIKVGNETPFRGKGYATKGNVISIEKGVK